MGERMTPRSASHVRLRDVHGVPRRAGDRVPRTATGTSVFWFAWQADIDDHNITGRLQQVVNDVVTGDLVWANLLDADDNPQDFTIRRPDGWPVIPHNTGDVIPAVLLGTEGDPVATIYGMIAEPLPDEPGSPGYKVLGYDSGGNIVWDYPRAHP